MTGRHLTDDELDRLLVGEAIDPEAAEHAASCLVCRHRRDGFLGAVEAARAPEPDAERVDALREAALSRWSGGRSRRRHWWLAAAAVFFLLVLVPLTRGPRQPREALDTEAVLREVDAVLARDPLTVMAPQDLVEAVIPSAETSTSGSAS
jgi:hypothetical protein